MQFVNHYYCDVCDVEWSDAWSCTCNDDCPVCGREIQPYESDDYDPDCEEDDAPPAVTEPTEAGLQYVIPGCEKDRTRGAVQMDLF